MPSAAVDPSRLQGDALRQWYLRSPQDIESERQAEAAQRYDAFFGRPGGAGIDSGFNTAVERPLRDIDPGFALIPKGNWRDIDPEFSAMPAGVNRWRIERPAADRTGEGLHRVTNYAAKVGAPTGEVRPTNGTISATPRPGVAAASSAPPNYLDDLRRRRQAEFNQAARDADIQNSWFAVPALAPVAAVVGLEGAAALSGDALASQAARGPLSFIEREAWQGKAAVDRVAGKLNDAAKAVLRREGRARLAQAHGKSASEMGAQVHHTEPLEWAHLKPNADPNRLANLSGLPEEAHQLASNAWAAFKAELKGRMPTQAELMAVKLRIERLVEPYIVRPGVARPRLPPK